MNFQIRLRITGRVHGVYFRQGVADKARELGLTGFVMNLEDGSVVLEAIGGTEQLEELERWCHIGPPRAIVRQVVRETPLDTGGFVGFRIRR